MFLVDTAAGRIVDDAEVKSELAAQLPYQQWLSEGLVHLDDLPPRQMLTPQHASIVGHQRLFSMTREDLHTILAPMASGAEEALGSMGTDTPIAVLSERPRLLYDYFTQLFAQVTNPPLDAIREALVTSLQSKLGPEQNLLQAGPASCRRIVLPYPVLDNDELAKLLYIDAEGAPTGFSCFAVDGLFPVAAGGAGLEEAISKMCAKVSEAIALGANIIVLSDRHATAELAPIPALLMTAAVHNHLVREKERTRAGLVIETGEAREIHHLALLIGYGAAAVNPYLAFDSVAELARDGVLSGLSEREAVRRYATAASKGVLKVMSKMGISTKASYTGAQVFEAVGLDKEFVSRHFTGTPSRLGGIGAAEIAEEVRTAPRGCLRGPVRPFRTARDPDRGRVPVAPGRRVPPVQPEDGAQAPALHPRPPLRHLQGVHEPGRRPVGATGHAARAVAPPPRPGSAARAARAGRAGERDREALRDRGDELRLDLGRGS